MFVGLAFTVCFCLGISVDFLIALPIMLFIHFPLLTLCVGEKPPAETGTESPESTLSLWRILHLKV